MAATNLPDGASTTKPSVRCASTTAIVYVASARQGVIGVYQILQTTAKLALIELVPAGASVMPLVLDMQRRQLFAMTRALPYSLLTFDVDPQTGTLSRRRSRMLDGNYVQFAALRDRPGFVAASYGGHTIGMLRDEPDADNPAPDENLRTAAETWIGRDGRHPHCVVSSRDGRHLYVPFLGEDYIVQYGMHDGRHLLTHPDRVATVSVDAATGPRHAVLSSDERFFYVIGEMSGMVLVFERDLATGRLTLLQSRSSIPAGLGLQPGKPRAPGDLGTDDSGSIWCADIQLSPNGRFLYTSERTSGTISRFLVDAQEGTVRFAGITATAKGARALAITKNGDFLLAASTTASRLHLFRIDPHDGGLDLVDDQPCGEGAAWIETGLL